MSAAITTFSPAKINLTLDVFPKKPAALFHEIDTVFHLLDWGDPLSLEPANTFTLEGDFDCALEDNLIYRTWELMQQIPLNPPFPKWEESPFLKGRTKEEFLPVRVTVKKNIPAGAGLGGGSSNAATFVQAYFQCLNLGPIPDELIAALAKIGKDIPFFLSGATCARGTHYGEIVEPLDYNFSGTPVYVYYPNFKHSTAWAYQQLKIFDTHHTKTLLASGKITDCGNGFDHLFEQNNYSKILNHVPQNSLHMSGSGSAFFSFKPLNVDCPHITTKLS